MRIWRRGRRVGESDPQMAQMGTDGESGKERRDLTTENTERERGKVRRDLTTEVTEKRVVG